MRSPRFIAPDSEGAVFGFRHRDHQKYSVEVRFAGLDADNPDLYRLDVVVPEAAAGAGIQPLVLAAGEFRSKPVMLPIE